MKAISVAPSPCPCPPSHSHHFIAHLSTFDLNDKETESHHSTLALLWGQEGILYGWQEMRRGAVAAVTCGKAHPMSLQQEVCSVHRLWLWGHSNKELGLCVVRKKAESKGRAGTLAEVDPLEAQKTSLVPSSSTTWRCVGFVSKNPCGFALILFFSQEPLFG